MGYVIRRRKDNTEIDVKEVKNNPIQDVVSFGESENVKPVSSFSAEEIKNNDSSFDEDALKNILEQNIVKVQDNGNDALGKDLQEIAKELTKDSNVFKFGNTDKLNMGYDSLLGAIGDKPFYDPKVKPRYAFIQSFRYHNAVNHSALKSGQADRFKDVAGSLLGFKAMLEYRQAGIMNPMQNEEKKHNLLDKIKKG